MVIGNYICLLFKSASIKIDGGVMCRGKRSTQHFVQHHPARSTVFIKNSNIIASLWMFSSKESDILCPKCQVNFQEVLHQVRISGGTFSA